jgi:ipoprotein LpqH
VKRELLIAIGAATIVVAGVAGCSNNNKSSSPPSSATSSSATQSASATQSTTIATSSGTASSAAGSAKITIDGQPQNTSGQQVVCSTTDGKFSIAIGEPIVGTIVGLEPDASVVHIVGLGNTVNGVVLSFTEGAPGNTATASKNGNNYKITGTATGTDTANGQQISKPFEIDATCP